MFSMPKRQFAVHISPLWGELVHLLPKAELLDGEIFYSLAEARIVIESWRRHYNTERPHGSLGYKPPAPEVFIPALAARAASQPRPATLPALAEKPTMN
jgi:putative transposase